MSFVYYERHKLTIVIQQISNSFSKIYQMMNLKIWYNFHEGNSFCTALILSVLHRGKKCR